MNVRIGGVNKCSLIDSCGISYSIFCQGCSLRCKGCHNPSLWDHAGGEELSTDDIVTDFEKDAEFCDNLVLMGGEPTDQPEAMVEIINKIRDRGHDHRVWLYTGRDIEDVPWRLLNECTIVIAGPFVESLKAGQKYRGSSNQRIYMNNGGHGFVSTNENTIEKLFG